MEDERIEAVKNWPKSKLVWNIQVFISFIDFYWQFIQSFNRIMAPLTWILKTNRSSDLTQRDDDNQVDRGSSNDRSLSKSMLKNAKSRIQTHIRATREPIFLNSGTREAFNHLRQAITKAPILQQFDPKYYIRIKTDALGYTIGGVLSQLTSDQVTLDSESILTKSDFG